MLAVASLLATSAALVATTTPANAATRTYTTNGDWNGGEKSNVVAESDDLKLGNTSRAFEFMWVAVSTKGTIVKIDTDTGAIVGEYKSAPDNESKDPSRTTVDLNGNVWATNRANSSMLHIGLVENNQCVDRNLNGVIDTSTAANDIRAWTTRGANQGTVAGLNNGEVGTAADECIIHYTFVSSFGTRHVSVNGDNDVWVSGVGDASGCCRGATAGIFDLIDGSTGKRIRGPEGPAGGTAYSGYGGYGGLITKDGVIWSARPLLRWDTANTLTGANGTNWTGYGHDSYGLCIDKRPGKEAIWNTSLSGDQIRKFASDGTLIGTYSHGTYNAQGCVVDAKGHVWVASSLYDSYVSHLLPDGTFVGNVLVPSGPTGVAVDDKGKIWTTSYNAGTVSRIDPNLGPIGGGGVNVGAVNFTTVGLGGNPYDYSDMTGGAITSAALSGTWQQVYDSHVAGSDWGTISWSADTLDGSSVQVTAASSNDGVLFEPPVTVTNGTDFNTFYGRYLQIRVILTRGLTGTSPVVHDLTVGTGAGASNAPANVDAGPDVYGFVNNPAPVDGTIDDPDGTATTATWSVPAGTPCTFADIHAVDTTVTCTSNGPFTATLTASNTTNGHVSDTVPLYLASELPNLVVSALDNPPAVGNMGSKFPILDTVRNASGVATTGPTNVAYYFSSDQVLDSGDKKAIGGRKVPLLGPNASNTRPANKPLMLKIPGGWSPAGPYYLLACADTKNTTPESNEADNCRASAATMTITAPNLVVSVLGNPPANATVGSFFDVSYTLANISDGAAGASTTRFFLSLDTRKSAHDVNLTGTDSAPALPATSSSPRGPISVGIPAGAAPGMYYLIACADQVAPKVLERNETDNCTASAGKVTVS